MRRILPLLAAGTTLLVGCRSSQPRSETGPEATSLLGRPLERSEPADEARARHSEALAEANERWREARTEEDAIWVGRHLAYLGRMREAVEWYTQRLEDFPDSYRLRRHRGHRYVTLRRFDEAVRDLALAWELCAYLPPEVEPDGMPNRYGIPTGTTQTSVLYHLALAFYLKGDFPAAAEVWGECLARSDNDDMRAASANWLVHALRRDGREAEARAVLAGFRGDEIVFENVAYLRLLYLQKAMIDPGQVGASGEDGVQDATAGYGIGAWSWCNGDREGAIERWRRVVAETPWAAFGHIAAEAELARLKDD